MTRFRQTVLRDWACEGTHVRRRVLTDGGGRDRQVLVVGERIPALLSAGFLEHAGLEPVVAGVADGHEPPTSPLTTIWRPGITLLDRLGLRRPIEREGTPLVRLQSLDDGSTWSTDSSAPVGLLTIPTGRLERLLSSQLRRRIRHPDRSVVAIESSDAGVSATFERGVTETFDAAVTTTGAPRSAAGIGENDGTLGTWSFWSADDHRPTNTECEGWATDNAAILTSVADGTYVRLLSTETDVQSPVDVAAIETQFEDLFRRSQPPFEGLTPEDLDFHRPRQRIRTSRRAGRVAYIGDMCRTSTPGDCIGTALCIEDAWVLADALAYGPTPVEAALEQFQKRRRQRDSTIEALLEGERPPDSTDGTLSPTLQRLRAARRLAFGHVIDGSFPSIVNDVPERL